MDKPKAGIQPIWIGISLVVIAMAAVGGYVLLGKSEQAQGPVRLSDKVTFAIGNAPHHALVHVASVNGYFSDEGLDVTLQMHTSGKAAVRSLLDGKADLTTLGDIPFMFAVMRGAKIKLLTTMTSSDKNLAIVANKTRGIQAPKDMSGRPLPNIAPQQLWTAQ